MFKNYIKHPMYILLMIFGFLGCTTITDPNIDSTAEQSQESTPITSPNSLWLQDAITRRSKQPSIEPNSSAIKIGLLASAAVNWTNKNDPGVFSFRDDPQASASYAKDILERVWGIYSRNSLLTTLDNLAYRRGLPGLYTRVLELMLNRPEGLGRPNLFLNQEFWDSYIEGHPDSQSDVDTLMFILKNQPFMSYSSFSAFELGRLSSLVRWGLAAGYLDEEEASILMEDIGIILVTNKWDFPMLAHAQLLGIGMLNRSRQNLQIETTRRGIVVWELLQDMDWRNEIWLEAEQEVLKTLNSGKLALPEYYTRITLGLPELPGSEEKISNDIRELFNPQRKPESLLPYYKKDYDLYKAISENNLSTIDSLLRRYQYIDGAIIHGSSWVDHAVPNSQALKQLLEAGFNPNITSGNNFSALFRAATERNLESMKLLIEYGAQVQLSHKISSATPLTMCISKDFLPGLTLLLENGADPNIGFVNDYPPLVYSLQYRRPEFALILLEYGADPTQPTPNGWPPLHISMQFGTPELVKAIVAQGVHPDTLSGNGTPAIITAASADKTDTLKTLLELGADPDLKSMAGYPALHSYLSARHFNIWNSREAATWFDPVNTFAPELPTYLNLFPQQRILTAGENHYSLLWFLRAYASEPRFIEELEFLQGNAPEILKEIPPNNQYDIANALISRGFTQAFQKFSRHMSVEGLNYRIENGYHLLYYALTDPTRYWAADILMDLGVDPDSPGYKDHTPIIAVLDDGEIHKALELIECGADISQLNTYRKEPIFTTFLEVLRKSDIPMDEKRQIIYHAIDLGGKLLNFQDYPRQYWRMPYYQLGAQGLRELLPEIAAYYIDKGNPLGNPLAQKMIQEGSLVTIDPENLIPLPILSSEDITYISHQNGRLTVGLSSDWSAVEETGTLPITITINADGLDTSTMLLLENWLAHPSPLPDQNPIRLSVSTDRLARIQGGLRVFYPDIIFEAKNTVYLLRLRIVEPMTVSD